ncbi:MAG: hypothetical protein H6Q55_3803 [Deltaproteobacteria bacterium]|nr:hypothetical protein [Deltaproteobacteria bacterium]
MDSVAVDMEVTPKSAGKDESYDQKISKLVQSPENRQRNSAKQNGVSAHGFPGHYRRGLCDKGGCRFL